MNLCERALPSAEQMHLLADKYETKDFLKNDPSQFMHLFSDVIDIEVAAFIAANLSFGRREQILKSVKLILSEAGASPAEWILNKTYESFFPESDKSFYRMFSFKTMRIFFDVIYKILKESKTLGEFFHAEFLKMNKMESFEGMPFSKIIASVFPKECSIIPHGKNSADKRLQMFLRWMVRDSSPVDMGLWTWFKKTDLLLPLDTHVIQEATHFGFLKPAASGKYRAASLKTDIMLTKQMQAYFPEDPVRADFALFGLGVDSGK